MRVKHPRLSSRDCQKLVKKFLIWEEVKMM